MSAIELILHPIRIRIITTLAGRSLSPQQIGALMPDIAQTTLYRHINALAEGHILKIASEQQVRGTVERVYTLEEGAARLDLTDLANVSKDDFFNYFLVFMSSVMQDFSSYVESRLGGPFTEAFYSKTPLYLTEADLATLLQQVGELLQPYLSSTPDEGRQRFLFTGIVIPDQDSPSDDNDPRKADS